jgi:DNA-binding response OmpR family regulator
LKPTTLLYVEDEVLIALEGEVMLRELGFERITVAFSFPAAEAAIREQDFDFALLDINLGDGHTSLPLADRLLAAGTRVIFASGYNSAEGLVKHLDAPMVQKPFDEAALRQAVDTVLGASTP